MTATALCGLPAASAGQEQRGRCLHLIDLESLAGAGNAPTCKAGRLAAPSDQLVRLTWASYGHAIGIQRGDHAMVGLRAARCGRLSDLLANCDARLRVARDPADVRAALLDSIDIAHAARRFDWLVIAGGDEAFAGLASAARSSGMRIWLVGGITPFAPTLAALRVRQSRLQPRRAAA